MKARRRAWRVVRLESEREFRFYAPFGKLAEPFSVINRIKIVFNWEKGIRNIERADIKRSIKGFSRQLMKARVAQKIPTNRFGDCKYLFGAKQLLQNRHGLFSLIIVKESGQAREHSAFKGIFRQNVSWVNPETSDAIIDPKLDNILKFPNHARIAEI